MGFQVFYTQVWVVKNDVTELAHRTWNGRRIYVVHDLKAVIASLNIQCHSVKNIFRFWVFLEEGVSGVVRGSNYFWTNGQL